MRYGGLPETSAFELVFAESLHRSLVTVLLRWGKLPTLPQSVWRLRDKVLLDKRTDLDAPLVEFDRAACFDAANTLRISSDGANATR